MAIGSRIIHGPIAGERTAVSVDDSRMVWIAVNIGIAQARPHPLCFLVPIRRLRKIRVLDGGVLFEGLLSVKNAPSGENRHETKGEGDTETHERRSFDQRTAISA